MDLQRELDELNSLTEVDRYCYTYYQRTGRYLKDPDTEVILDMLRRWPLYAQAKKLVAVEEYLAGGKAKDLNVLLQVEQLGFQEAQDVAIGRVVRYCEVPPHTHRYFELQCVLKGNAVYSSAFGKRTLMRGDLILVPPDAVHELTVENDGTAITVSIRSSTFCSAFREIMENEASISRYFQSAIYGRQSEELFFHAAIDDFVLELLIAMYWEQQRQANCANQVNNHLIQSMMYYIAENCPASLAFPAPDFQNSKVWEIEMYIMEHYQEVDLQQLSARFHLSVPYLSSMLKKSWGCGFAKGLQMVRLGKACELLQKTNFSITEICRRIGYENDSYFIRTFREIYGETPGQYRKRTMHS